MTDMYDICMMSSYMMTDMYDMYDVITSHVMTDMYDFRIEFLTVQNYEIT